MIRAIGGVHSAYLFDGQWHANTVLLDQDHDAAGNCARFPGRLSSRISVDRAPAATAAAATKAVADDALSVGLFSFPSGVDRTGETRTEWWLVDGLTGPRSREENKKKTKTTKTVRIISDQQKRKYTKHGCPTILFNIFVVHGTVSVPVAVSVYGVDAPPR